MRSSFASGLRAGCVAVALILASAYAAEQKQTVIGATREQVLARYGEPRSVMAAGGREILFFARERIVLRDGVVVEVEPLAAEPAPRRPAAAPAVAPAATTAAAPIQPAAEPAAATPRPPTQATNSAQPGSPADAQSATATTTGAPATATAAPADAGGAFAVGTAGTSSPQIAIKSVRPPTGAYVRPPLKKAEAAAPETAPVATETPTPSAAPAETPRAQPETVSPTRATEPLSAGERKTTVSAASPAAQPAASDSLRAAAAVVQPTEAPSVAEVPVVPDSSAPPAAPEKPAIQKRQRVAADELQFPEPAESIFTGRTYLISFLVIVVGGAFLFWQIRQRQLELAATAVSQNPFSFEPAAAVGSGARVTPEFLSKLDANHFEELVAAYYGKTGVVAERLKGVPGSPVHIKISWKGETRPFALVQCIAQPQGLVDVKPLQDLFAALTAEDIRRGYVVTSGKFNVEARDFAEEKHLTLMSGDIFLEKLNALPDSARAEAMQEVMTSETSAPPAAH